MAPLLLRMVVMVRYMLCVSDVVFDGVGGAVGDGVEMVAVCFAVDVDSAGTGTNGGEVGGGGRVGGGGVGVGVRGHGNAGEGRGSGLCRRKDEGLLGLKL